MQDVGRILASEQGLLRGEASVRTHCSTDGEIQRCNAPSEPMSFQLLLLLEIEIPPLGTASAAQPPFDVTSCHDTLLS